MASALYNRDILRLATSLPSPDRLQSPDASADRRSPTCGSRVIADVRLDDEGHIEALALTVSACALGQASAALVQSHAVGRTAQDMQRATEALRAFLSAPDAPIGNEFWPGIHVFAPARSYPARHPSILLAFEVVSEAGGKAMKARALHPVST